MVAEPARRLAPRTRAPRTRAERRAQQRGRAGLLVAGVAFAATVGAGLYVVDLVRDFGAGGGAAIQAAGTNR